MKTIASQTFTVSLVVSKDDKGNEIAGINIESYHRTNIDDDSVAELLMSAVNYHIENGESLYKKIIAEFILYMAENQPHVIAENGIEGVIQLASSGNLLCKEFIEHQREVELKKIADKVINKAKNGNDSKGK